MPTTVATADPRSLAEGARAMLRAGRPEAARPLLTALVRLAPDAADLPELECGLAEIEGRFGEALAVLDRALAATPANTALRLRRAGLRHRTGDTAAAICDAADAVIAAPGNPSAKALLGLLLLEVGDVGAARACLSEAVAEEPDNADFRLGLAESARRSGDLAGAAATLQEGIRRVPDRPDLRDAASRLAVLGQHAATVERPARAVFGSDGTQESLRDRGSGEAMVLRAADPTLHATVPGGGPCLEDERASVAHVRAHFEAAAPGFAAAALATRDRVPGLVRSIIMTHVPLPEVGRLGPVLDLGCGSGLLGVALSDLALGPFVGVDLSAAMLAEARQWDCYSELIVSDLCDFLATEERRFPVILAADVLCWFGSLESVFAAIAPRLGADGHLVVTLDAPGSDESEAHGWVRRPHGRYAHGAAAVERWAGGAGLAVVRREREILRFENGAPVRGSIAVLRRGGNAG